MCVSESTRDFWNALAADLERERPSVGKPVYVAGGRKHRGKFGRVIRHQIDRFSVAYRYGSDASLHMHDLRGTYGWACLVESAGGCFWVRADYLTIAEPIR